MKLSENKSFCRCDLDEECFAIVFNKSSADCLNIHNATIYNQTKYFCVGQIMISLKNKGSENLPWNFLQSSCVVSVFELILVKDLSTCCLAGSCQSRPCQNGGSCFEIKDGFTCECPVQLNGFACEKGDDNKY